MWKPLSSSTNLLVKQMIEKRKHNGYACESSRRAALDPEILRHRHEKKAKELQSYLENLTYQQEIKAYEGFYVTESSVIRQSRIGTVPFNPNQPQVIEAAEFALEQHNKTIKNEESYNEPLKLKKVVRCNLTMVAAGALYFVTLEASDDRFYEVSVLTYFYPENGVPGEVKIFRPAKFYPSKP